MLTRIKILRIIATLNPTSGGPASHIFLITPILTNLAIETTVICFDEPNDDFIQNAAFKVIALGKPISAWQYNHKLKLALQQYIQFNDVVIQHGIWLYHGFAIRSAMQNNSRLKNIPVLIYPHGMLDPYYQKAENRKLKALRNFFFYKLVERKVLGKATALIFTSNEELKNHEKSFGKINGPLKVNLGYTSAYVNTLPTPQFKNNDLLYLGRITPKKGLDNILIAWERFIKTYKKNAKLVLAGFGWETEYGNKLKLSILTNPILKDSILMLPHQSNSQKFTLLLHSKATILWSFHENFAQSVSESLSAGTPTLITNKVNIYEEVLESNAGLIGNPTSEDAFKAIVKLYSLNETSYFDLSNNAKNLYWKKFHPEKYGINFFSFLKTIIP